MEERCFRLDPEQGIVPVTADEVRVEHGVYWVDLADPAPAQPADWLERLGVARSTVGMLSQLPEVPRVFDVDGHTHRTHPKNKDRHSNKKKAVDKRSNDLRSYQPECLKPGGRPGSKSTRNDCDQHTAYR